MTTTVEVNGRRWRLSFRHRNRDGSISRREIKTRDGDYVYARTCHAYLIVSDLDGSNEVPACRPGIAFCKPPDHYVKETAGRLALRHLERYVPTAPDGAREAFLALKNAYYRRPRGVPRKPAPTRRALPPRPRPSAGTRAHLWDWFFGRGL